MVDPNPARGMPLQLQKYWLVGKGAAKIRWHLPHDFDRCVRNLRKYFPKNPEGLCNILHQKAVGAPPGKGHGEHSLTASMTELGSDMQALIAAQELLDRQPELGKYTWAGPLAPIGRPTGEPSRARVFQPDALYHRTLPLPLDWRQRTGRGHEGAVTVGRILGITYGPDHEGQDWCWGWGDFLDEDIIPEAGRARYLAKMGVAGPSLDPGGPLSVNVDPQTGMEVLSRFGIGGATLVSIPAFAALRPQVFGPGEDWPDDDPDMPGEYDMDEDCGCKGPETLVASVNSSGWRGLPLAPREAVFDNDDAVKRITAWASGGQDVERMKKAFMWANPSGPPTDPTSYRLPLGDIINGRLTLIFHAVYAAAALISGAHGGLPQIPERDIAEIRNVISDIYPIMAREFNDGTIRAPWDRSQQEGVQLAMSEFAATQPYGDVAYADPGYRDSKKRYPIDTPAHIRAAWSYINQADNAKMYDAEQLQAIKDRIMAAAKRAGIQISEQAMSMREEYSATGFPVYPPKAWFNDPGLTQKTRMTVTDEGHVFGHLALWNECHRDFAQKECVLAPRSRQDYQPFHLGTVVTAEGDTLSCGKIIMDTRHAGIHLGYAAAAVHYDNTGDEVALIRCGEDEYGIWFSGAVVPEADHQKVAKLRRSPLSGDWRREKGSLELTAALAVNAPAFPVYAMDEGERTALTAAGSVWLDDEAQDVFVPPTGISVMAAVQDYVADRFSQAEGEDLVQEFDDLMEDDQIYAQREFDQLMSFSVDPAYGTPAPAAAAAPAVAPAPAAPGAAPTPAPDAPAPADGESATDAAGMDVDAWQVAAENSARYVVVKPGIGNINAAPQQAQQPGFMQQAPAPPAQ